MQSSKKFYTLQTTVMRNRTLQQKHYYSQLDPPLLPLPGRKGNESKLDL